MIQIIQILRLIGAGSISIYHSGLAGEHGFWAVDLFFVVSGFLLIHSTERRVVTPGEFLSARLLRIVPLYWILTVFMYLLILVMPSLSVMSEARIPDLIRSLLFIPFENSRGYCAPVLSLGWTLQYEVLVYFLFAAAMALSYRHRAEITALLILLLVLAGAAVRFAGGDLPVFLDFFTDSILLEFILGFLAYRIWRMVRFAPGNGGEMLQLAEVSAFRILSAAGMGVLIVMAVRFENRYEIPRWVRLGLPAFGIFLFAVAGFGRDQFPKGLLHLAAASYSIYLIEYFGMAAFKVAWPAVLSVLGLNVQSLPGQAVRLACFLCILCGVLCVSLLSRRWIEEGIGSLIRKKQQ